MQLVDQTLHWTTLLRCRLPHSRPLPANEYVPGFVDSFGSLFGVWVNDFQPGYLKDPIGFLTFAGPALPVSIPGLVGWSSFPASSEEVLYSKPENRHYDGGDDWRHYANPISGLLSLGQGSRRLRMFEHEHPVWHSKPGGRASTRGVGVDLLRRDTLIGTAFGTIMGGRNYATYNRFGVFVHPVFGDIRFQPKAGGTLPGAEWFLFIEDFCQYLEDVTGAGSFTYQYSGYASGIIEYRDIHWSTHYAADRAEIKLSYEMRHDARHFGNLLCSDTYKVTMTHGLKLLPAQPREFDLGDFTLSNMAEPFWSFTYDRVDSIDYVQIPDAYEGKWPRQSIQGMSNCSNQPLADLVVDRSGQNREPLGYRDFTSMVKERGVMRELEAFVTRNQYDIRATALFAAADAVTGYDISSNFVESLPDLPALLKIPAVLTSIGGDARSVLRGDLSRIGALARHLSEAYLAYIYGVSPTANDVRNLARVVQREMSARIDESEVLYGTFRYVFDENPIGSGTLSLVSRSKVVINGLSSLANLLLASRSVGVGLTLANLWDLVPFSFVADWFVNLGDRFQDIDDSVLLATLSPSYFVNSFTVRYSLSDDEKARYGLQLSSDPWFQVYMRDVSRYNPVPRDTSIDWRAPASLQKRLVSAGALIAVLS